MVRTGEPEVCDDTSDNDLDGLGDCTDDDCSEDAACECVDYNLTNATGAEASAGDNTAATDDFSGECGIEGGLDEVHVWSAPAAGCYQADTFGSDLDTVLRVIDACAGTEVNCSDDAENASGDYTSQSKLVVGAGAAGDAFLFVMDGYSETSVGSYLLNITEVASASSSVESDLASATGASVASGDSSSSTTTIDSECVSVGASVVFTWTAPSTGNYTFDTYGSSYDTVIGLMDSIGCSELACDDDGPSETNNESEMDTEVVSGELYHIVVSGYDAATGTYVLNINETAVATR
jgi:hypothetical protein